MTYTVTAGSKCETVEAANARVALARFAVNHLRGIGFRLYDETDTSADAITVERKPRRIQAVRDV